MLQGESGHSRRTPAFRRSFITGLMPSCASRFSRYCLTLGRKSLLGVNTTGLAVVINPTSVGPVVQRPGGMFWRKGGKISRSSVNASHALFSSHSSDWLCLCWISSALHVPIVCGGRNSKHVPDTSVWL